MQMFFLRNIVGVFIVALTFTAIHVGITAVRSMPASEGGNAKVIPQSDPRPIPTDLVPPPAEPMPTPEQKVTEELKKLDILPEDQDAEDMPSEGEESVPAIPGPDEMKPQIPSNQLPTSAEEMPIHFRANLDTVRPNLIKATLNFDNDDQPSPPKTDQDDPTSEGQGPGGKHKGGPKIVKFESIPIIKMGAEIPEGGFKVITPWNS